MIDTAAIIAVAFFSIRNEKRAADADEIGPFRLIPIKKSAPTPLAARAPAPVRRRRMRGL